jgi:hypothetical protein
MDVVNAISCMFLFIAAGPFLEIVLTSASQKYSSATQEPAQAGSVLGPI